MLPPDLLEDMGSDPEPVFATPAGTPLDPDNIAKRSFKPLLRKAGLPDARFHDLRHTCVTLLLGGAVHPKGVQEVLDHATVSITLDTYSHLLPGMQEGAVGAMKDALGGAGGGGDSDEAARSSGPGGRRGGEDHENFDELSEGP